MSRTFLGMTMRYLFCCVGLFLALLFIPHLATLRADAPPSTQPSDDDGSGHPRLIINLFWMDEKVVKGSAVYFVAQVRNFTDQRETLVDLADVRLYCDKDRSLTVINNVPRDDSERLNPYLHVRLDIEAPALDKGLTQSAVISGRNGLIADKPLGESGTEYAEIPVLPSAWAAVGKYRVTAILLRGDQEIARSNSHTIDVINK